MPAYNSKIARELLNESEKDRIIAVFLNTSNGTTNWEKAAAEYGSASVESMKKSLRNVFGKLDKAGAQIDDDGYVVPGVPAKTAKGGKRKAAAEVGEGDEKLEKKTKTTKKMNRVSRKNVALAETADDDDEVEEKVKDEEEEEEEE